MSPDEIEQAHHKTFEDIRHIETDGTEYWLAREIGLILDYRSWDKFLKVIQKAAVACKNSGQNEEDHFSQTGKMVDLGSGAKRDIQDFKLSRYACYLIVQNGDPSKPVIALGQTYFALQTRRQEVGDGTALQHLLAMQTGGSGGTVFASMFAVRCDEPRLTLVQRAKCEAGEVTERALRQIDETGDDKDAVVLTRQAAMSVLTVPEWLTVTPQRETQVFVQRDVQSAVVHQSDVLEMTQ